MITINFSKTLTESELNKLSRDAAKKGFRNAKEYIEAEISRLIKKTKWKQKN